MLCASTFNVKKICDYAVASIQCEAILIIILNSMHLCNFQGQSFSKVPITWKFAGNSSDSLDTKLNWVGEFDG